MSQLDQLLKEIVVMTKPESMDLESRGKAGDLEALKKWVLYSGWERIQQDRSIAPKTKVRLFKHILQLVQLSAEAVADPDEALGDDPPLESTAAAASATAEFHIHEPINVAGTTLCKVCGVQSFA